MPSFGANVRHDRSTRSFRTIVPVHVLTVVLTIVLGSCTKPGDPGAEKTLKPGDSQHAGITTPHGDHTPHHGGLVMMDGDYHYEVVFDRSGRHSIWFSDAVREDLPASIASRVIMTVTRKNAPPETLSLTIDESGESWIAAGQPVSGDDVMVKITYELRGNPFEVEIPFVANNVR
jgi:hypothetical protein